MNAEWFANRARWIAWLTVVLSSWAVVLLCVAVLLFGGESAPDRWITAGVGLFFAFVALFVDVVGGSEKTGVRS